MECIFCKIVRGEEEAAILYEDKKWMVILDKFPIYKGQALIITKEHLSTNVEELPEEYLEDFPRILKKVIEMLKKGLGVKKVGIIIEGTGILHFHVKLYPLHGWKGEIMIVDEPKVWFDKYPGYMTSLIGKEWKIEDLKKLAEDIKSKLQ